MIPCGNPDSLLINVTIWDGDSLTIHDTILCDGSFETADTVAFLDSLVVGGTISLYG